MNHSSKVAARNVSGTYPRLLCRSEIGMKAKRDAVDPVNRMMASTGVSSESDSWED
jgi:hypothetical protein